MTTYPRSPEMWAARIAWAALMSMYSEGHRPDLGAVYRLALAVEDAAEAAR